MCAYSHKQHSIILHKANGKCHSANNQRTFPYFVKIDQLWAVGGYSCAICLVFPSKIWRKYIKNCPKENYSHFGHDFFRKFTAFIAIAHCSLLIANCFYPTATSYVSPSIKSIEPERGYIFLFLVLVSSASWNIAIGSSISSLRTYEKVPSPLLVIGLPGISA